MLEKAFKVLFQRRRNSLPKLGLATMVHIIICVTLGGIMVKDCILWLRTYSWDIFDMLPMCLFSKGIAGFANCMFCLMTWKAL